MKNEGVDGPFDNRSREDTLATALTASKPNLLNVALTKATPDLLATALEVILQGAPQKRKKTNAKGQIHD